MSDQPASPLLWRDDGLPGSRLYGDVYFSSEDGLAETGAVFLAGCGLPEAWAGRTRFTVAELGFGTGLNIAALLTLWKQTRPPGARLHIFSIEAHPISAADAGRALGRWPAIAEAAGALLEAWPGLARGFHRLDLPGFDAVLDVAVMEASPALAAWSGAADAWFLDGFAPAANPAMWSEALMAQVGAHTAPGGRAATFTVAGSVRRGLAAAGFEVAKRPGFGRKRERLEACWPGAPTAAAPAGEIAIIGAGIAGAAMARALRQEGRAFRLFDPAGPAAAASGNRAALMTPRLDAGDGPAARLFAQAFARARTLYEATPGAVLSRGVRHLASEDRDAGRFARIAAGGLFEPSDMIPDAAGVLMASALVLDPARLVPAWTGEVERRSVAALSPHPEGGWRLLDGDGGLIMRAAGVVVCAGHLSGELAAGLELGPVRGQTTFAAGARLDMAVSFGGYAAPTPDGVLFGASHQRGEADTTLRAEDDQDNLARIAGRLPTLAGDLAGRTLTGRAAIRAATPDHLPLAGAVPGAETLLVLSGLGGRGFCLAPLLAEHLVAGLVGAPSPLPRDLVDAVDPARFARRAARRSGGRQPRAGASQSPAS
ncbi:MAG: FAD-dependent 5-carboxymethylaminomethyl-2-thiouridine(34) oxidoreductase MnmC [Caulobacter sp.]|nr:FAD-dependent 5-carboxymethylaminomethyl-2-thiouridine(34) oxidoreductase MnmC [Caulobacter sp.]